MPESSDPQSTSPRPWVGGGSPPSQPGDVDDDARPARPHGDPQTGRRASRGGSDDSIGSFLKELPVLLLIAFGLAFLLRTFVVQVFFIPSESMVPTLQVDDRIVVEKISYLFDGPDRGDVVVFAGEEGFPTAQESGVQRVIRGVGQFLGVVPVDARDLVKRVIGLPGDTVVVDEGTVTVNGVELDEPYAQLGGPQGEWTVPEGKLFVLGDNRSNSADSRSESLGFVDLDNVVGRAVLKIWPLDRFGGIEGADYPPIPEPGEDGGGALPVAPAPALGAVPVMGFVARRRPRPLTDLAA